MGDCLTDKGHLPTFTETFEQAEPWFLSIGLSLDEFWNGEPRLARVYRQAHEIRLREINVEQYRMGIYISHALASTVGNMFRKKGSRPIQYLSEPLPLTQKDADAIAERKEDEREERIKQRMFALMKGGGPCAKSGH